MITVANKRKPKYRGPVAFDPPFFYIGRPDPLGNPFVIGEDGDRAEVIAKYKIWLRDQYYSLNIRVVTSIDRLVTVFLEGQDITLVCWCAPAPCHGDVIKEFVEELVNDRKNNENGSVSSN